MSNHLESFLNGDQLGKALEKTLTNLGINHNHVDNEAFSSEESDTFITNSRDQLSTSDTATPETLVWGKVTHDSPALTGTSFYKLQVESTNVDAGFLIVCRSASLSNFKLAIVDESGEMVIEQVSSCSSGSENTHSEAVLYFSKLDTDRVPSSATGTANGRKSALKSEEEAPSLYTALNTFKGCSKAILPGQYVVAVQYYASQSSALMADSGSSCNFSISAVTATSDLQSVDSVRGCDEDVLQGRERLHQLQDEYQQARAALLSVLERSSEEERRLCAILVKRSLYYSALVEETLQNCVNTENSLGNMSVPLSDAHDEQLPSVLPNIGAQTAATPPVAAAVGAAVPAVECAAAVTAAAHSPPSPAPSTVQAAPTPIFAPKPPGATCATTPTRSASTSAQAVAALRPAVSPSSVPGPVPPPSPASARAQPPVVPSTPPPAAGNWIQRQLSLGKTTLEALVRSPSSLGKTPPPPPSAPPPPVPPTTRNSISSPPMKPPRPDRPDKPRHSLNATTANAALTPAVSLYTTGASKSNSSANATHNSSEGLGSASAGPTGSSGGGRGKILARYIYSDDEEEEEQLKKEEEETKTGEFLAKINAAPLAGTAPAPAPAPSTTSYISVSAPVPATASLPLPAPPVPAPPVPVPAPVPPPPIPAPPVQVSVQVPVEEFKLSLSADMSAETTPAELEGEEEEEGPEGVHVITPKVPPPPPPVPRGSLSAVPGTVAPTTTAPSAVAAAAGEACAPVEEVVVMSENAERRYEKEREEGADGEGEKASAANASSGEYEETTTEECLEKPSEQQRTEVSVVESTAEGNNEGKDENNEGNDEGMAGPGKEIAVRQDKDKEEADTITTRAAEENHDKVEDGMSQESFLVTAAVSSGLADQDGPHDGCQGQTHASALAPVPAPVPFPFPVGSDEAEDVSGLVPAHLAPPTRDWAEGATSSGLTTCEDQLTPPPPVGSPSFPLPCTSSPPPAPPTLAPAPPAVAPAVKPPASPVQLRGLVGSEPIELDAADCSEVHDLPDLVLDESPQKSKPHAEDDSEDGMERLSNDQGCDGSEATTSIAEVVMMGAVVDTVPAVPAITTPDTSASPSPATVHYPPSTPPPLPAALVGVDIGLASAEEQEEWSSIGPFFCGNTTIPAEIPDKKEESVVEKNVDTEEEQKVEEEQNVEKEEKEGKEEEKEEEQEVEPADSSFNTTADFADAQDIPAHLMPPPKPSKDSPVVMFSTPTNDFHNVPTPALAGAGDGVATTVATTGATSAATATAGAGAGIAGAVWDPHPALADQTPMPMVWEYPSSPEERAVPTAPTAAAVVSSPVATPFVTPTAPLVVSAVLASKVSPEVAKVSAPPPAVPQAPPPVPESAPGILQTPPPVPPPPVPPSALPLKNGAGKPQAVPPAVSNQAAKPTPATKVPPPVPMAVPASAPAPAPSTAHPVLSSPPTRTATHATPIVRAPAVPPAAPPVAAAATAACNPPPKAAKPVPPPKPNLASFSDVAETVQVLNSPATAFSNGAPGSRTSTSAAPTPASSNTRASPAAVKSAPAAIGWPSSGPAPAAAAAPRMAASVPGPTGRPAAPVPRPSPAQAPAPRPSPAQAPAPRPSPAQAPAPAVSGPAFADDWGFSPTPKTAAAAAPATPVSSPWDFPASTASAASVDPFAAFSATNASSASSGASSGWDFPAPAASTSGWDFPVTNTAVAAPTTRSSSAAASPSSFGFDAFTASPWDTPSTAAPVGAAKTNAFSATSANNSSSHSLWDQQPSATLTPMRTTNPPPKPSSLPPPPPVPVAAAANKAWGSMGGNSGYASRGISATGKFGGQDDPFAGLG